VLETNVAASGRGKSACDQGRGGCVGEGRAKKPTLVAAPSPRASPGRRTVCGRTEQRRAQGSKRCKTKVRMLWGSFLIVAAAFKPPTRNGYDAQGVNLNLRPRRDAY